MKKELRNWDIGTKARQIHKFWQTENQLNGYKANANLIIEKFGEGESIFEVGCGSGMNYKFLKGKVGEYGCGDTTVNFLEILKEDYPELDPIELDIYNLPFKDGELKNIININVLQHLPYYEEPIKELVRVAGERLLVVTWCNKNKDKLKDSGEEGFHSNNYEINKLVKYCESLPGIKSVSFERYAGERYWVFLEKI